MLNIVAKLLSIGMKGYVGSIFELFLANKMKNKIQVIIPKGTPRN